LVPRIFTLLAKPLAAALMGRLAFVGLGLGARGVSLEGVREMKEADAVFLEYYTTPHEAHLIRELERETGKEVTVVDRGFVEDGKRILEEASAKRVVLAVPGDPMIATTHTELRVRAIGMGIETVVVHAATVASAIASASGLHFYKFGRTVTITRDSVDRLDLAYRLLHRNLLEGSHTLFLLEFDVDAKKGVTPGVAAGGLLKAESNFKRGVVSPDSFGLVLNRVGRPDARFEAGTFSRLASLEYGEPPYCLVVPGSIHFTEAEAIAAFFRVPQGAVTDNSAPVLRTAQRLIPKYVEKTKRALASVKFALQDPKYAPVIENAELYLKDAETFLLKGEDELAMLSIGYAEGLLDSLGFSGLVKIEW
jgi:diphthine synthase